MRALRAGADRVPRATRSGRRVHLAAGPGVIRRWLELIELCGVSESSTTILMHSSTSPSNAEAELRFFFTPTNLPCFRPLNPPPAPSVPPPPSAAESSSVLLFLPTTP